MLPFNNHASNFAGAILLPPVGATDVDGTKMKVYATSLRRQRVFTMTRDEDETSICQRTDQDVGVNTDVMVTSISNGVRRI